MRRGALGLTLAAAVIAGCTSSPDMPDPTAGTSSVTAVGTESVGTATGVEPATSTEVSVTQPGMLTGPGVDDVQISLGALVDPATDRGFQQGLRLWRDSVNGDGGVCGRVITLVDPTGGDDLSDAYRELGTGVLGFVTATESAAVTSDLGTLLSVDRVPALTVGGTAADLEFSSPVVIGPTADILAVNAADQLIAAGELSAGESVGVVSDGSPAAVDAIAGLRWYAGQHDLRLIVQGVADRDTAVLRNLPVVFALGSPDLTAEVAAAVPTATTVVTTLAGFDPTLLDETTAAHVEVALSTPAVGADHPGTAAIGAAVAAEGQTPGVLTSAGYATGVTWQRLLTAACDAGNLTRDGVSTALTTIGPASVESVLGASDPALPVTDGRPASQSSAMAAADLAAPGGLRALTGLVVADDIEDYLATK